MKGVQKKVLLAGFAAIFAFIVTIGSTYAWFTTTNVNTVQSMAVTVTTEDSLLFLLEDPTANTNTGYIYDIAHDKTFLDTFTNYKTVISNTDLAAYYTLSNYVMTPTTTTDGATFENRVGTPMSGNILVTMSFWVVSQGQAATVCVSDLVLAADNATPAKDFVIEAARLSIDGGEDATTVYGNDKEYDFDDSGTVIDSGDEATITALHGLYYQASGANETENTATLATATTAFDLAADTPEKITIRIWIEGWDGDCDNNLVAAVFSIGFSFRLKD